MLMVGHVLFSVTSGLYFSFMLLYGRLLFSQDYRHEEVI